jgi:hypothetical protein
VALLYLVKVSLVDNLPVLLLGVAVGLEKQETLMVTVMVEMV